MKAMKRFTRLVLALALLLSSGGLASAALTQEDYAVLDQYSGLTNFDLDQNGGIYVITSRKSAAKLIRLNDSGVEIASFDVTAGAAEITVSPAGGAVFYTVSDADKDNRVYKVTSAGADSYKEGFTFGGVPIVIDKIEAVSDDKVLIAWNAEYYEDAEFPNWLPKTVKIGQFSFSAAGEPEEVWTWAPQWEDGETNFDGNPYVKRLGDSWRYYLYFNPKTDAIVIYSTHYEKFFHTPTGRNHYSRNVTHVYEAGVSSFAEVPKSDFPDWANAFQEPFYTNGGVLMYRVNNSFTERPNFTQRVYLAKQGAREIIYDEYVESWQDGQGGAVNIADASNLPQAHIELISNYLADYRNNLYVINGIRNINTEETISLAFVK
ncbi:MAG: hypothetical protein LBQ58_05605, partial [Synergistaceae bacterium]|nr:hypothetical protein [Synergistaceae bacterium]